MALINKIGNATKSFLGLGGIDGMSVMGVGANNYRNDTPMGNRGWLFDTSPGVDIHFSYSGLSDIVKAYEQCPPVFAIINKQAYAYVNGRTFVTNTTGASKGKETTTPFAAKLKNLLNKPNALQNWKQFEAQAAIYLRLFGYCIILPIKAVGFPNISASALWIIPPYMCEITYAKKTFYNLKKGFISGIKVKYGEEITELNPEDVIILRDITPGFDSLFLPNSPIQPIQQNISNLIGIYNSKGMLINYRGALGILSPEIDPNGAMGGDPGDEDDIHKRYNLYGLKSGQRKLIITSSAMKWQQMGIAYRDLMLTEWTEDDTMIIADTLNYPYKLLSSNKSSSMNGTETDSHNKRLYQDFVIPFAEMIYEQINEAFECGKNGCKIEKDYSHITVLQEDKINAGRARLYLNQACEIEFLRNALTLNQWLALNETDPILLPNGNPDPKGNMYYYQLVEAGMTFGNLTSPTNIAQPNPTDNQTQNN